MSSAESDDLGFKLSHMVKAQRGMSDVEIEIFLATGQLPDLSLPPIELRNDDDDADIIDSIDDPADDHEIMTIDAARDWLSGAPLVAASFLDLSSSHSDARLRDELVFKFDPRQPRDGDGKWTDGFPGVNLPDLTSKPSGIKTGGSTKSTKKVTPAVIYKKHADGAIVGQSGDGAKRMRWAAGQKKFVVEQRKNDDWVEESALTKSAAYNDMKEPDKWFEPGEIGTEGKIPTPPQTPEPAPSVVDTTEETPDLPPGWKKLPGDFYYKGITGEMYKTSEVSQNKDGTWKHEFFDGKKSWNTTHDTLDEALARDPLTEDHTSPKKKTSPDVAPPAQVSPSPDTSTPVANDSNLSPNAYPSPEPVPEVDPDWPFSFEPFQEPQMDYGHLVRSNDDAYANDPTHNYELKTLPVSKIVPSQENDYEEWGDGLENDMTGKPFAIKKDGNFYLMDGHHRTAKAGETGVIDAWVLDLDKSTPDTPSVPDAPPTGLSVDEQKELADSYFKILDLFEKSEYWRKLDAEFTHKAGTGKVLTKYDLAESDNARKKLKELIDAATPLAERELELRTKRDGAPWGSIPDTNAARWAKKSAPSVFMAATADRAKIEKIADAYRINDKRTTENNMSLRSGNPSKAAKAWRGRMRTMLKSQTLMNDAVVYRGAALSPDRIMQLRPGSVMIDPGSMSTDETLSSAEFYAKVRLADLPGTIKTMFEIRAPKGIPVADVEYGEFVFDFDTPMRIISTTRENGTVNVVAELLTPEQAKELSNG